MDMNRRHLIGGSAAGVAGALAMSPDAARAAPLTSTLGRDVTQYGVRPGSFTHMTEFFGPMMAVMRFETLSEAVALVNQTGFGLTSGLESLDEREWLFLRPRRNRLQEDRRK